MRTDRRVDRWTEGETDMKKIIVAYPSFANAPARQNETADITHHTSDWSVHLTGCAT